MQAPGSELRAQLLTVFRAEAEEHVSALQGALLRLERGAGGEERGRIVEEMLRVAHTLKGAARAVGLEAVEARCQGVETLLRPVTRGEADVPGSRLTELHQHVNELTHAVLSASVPARPQPGDARSEGLAQSAVAPGAAAETVRIAAHTLERLIAHADALTAVKLALEERVGQMARLADALGRDSVGGALRAEARGLLRQFRGDHRTLARTVDDLGDDIRRVRLMPAAAVLSVFPPMVADLAAQQGKEVDCVVTGGEFDVDRQLLEAVKDPLIHLVRNAVDHGIERPEARLRAGKRPCGRVAIRLLPRETRRVTIAVEDDGAGIALDQVRQAAVRAGVIDVEAAKALSEESLLDLVYRSGVSTRAEVTRLSGHGVGLAIVRERVERLGGEVRTETTSGAGTTITLTLPATVATLRGLLLEAAGQSFLLPHEALGQVLRVQPSQIRSLDGRDIVRWRGRPLPLVPLSTLLGVAEASATEVTARPCVALESEGARLGLLVDEILGEREVLVKPLGRPLLRVRHVTGAGLLGTGDLALVLRPIDLVRASRFGVHPVRPRDEGPMRVRVPRILVVDDSITTRVMERNLLEAAGYEVRVAVDGLEAWTALKTEPFDLVVADVDMPRLDGLTLTMRVRDDRDLRDLPVVLVTALESAEHRARGAQVGASAYITKSAFDQTTLLEIIERLL